MAICSCPPPVHAEDVGGSGRLVRVGLVEPPGLQEKFAYQMLLNQLKGYLSEVSKHKRWQYVYDSGSYQECVERLRRGELDFVGPVSPGITTAGMIFVGGVPNWTLLNWYRVDDTPRPSLLSQSAKSVTVGFVVNDLTQSAVSFFMEKNDWHAKVRPFFDGPSMIAALRRGEIDAVCDNGSHAEPGMFSERSFAVVPARLMTTPDKQALCDELTDAVLTIEAVNPSFGTSLKGKYVDRALQTIARPTKTAERFVESTKELRVAVPPDFAPFFELREDGTANGLYMDILRLLSESSGLKFSFRRAESEPQIWQMLTSGEADMAFVSYADEISAVDVYYTGDVREEKFSVIRRKDGNMQPSARNVAVIPAGFPGAEQYFAKKYHQRIRTVESVEKCLDAVEAGVYETTYIPSLYLRRESTMFYHPSLEEADREMAEIPIALALSPKQPTILQIILNGSILRLDKNDVERLAYEYGRPTLSVAYLLEQYPLRIALFVGCMVAGLAGLCFVLSRNRLQRKQNEILQQKNRDLEIALERVEAMRISRDSYKQESETDGLTELYNKTGFENAVRKKLETMPKDRRGAFFIIDLDHFKEANDTYGHQCGDVILKKFSAMLKELFRQSDCLGRFGGDEFVIFIEGDLTEEGAAQKAKQIVEATRSITVEDTDIYVTASIGIAMYPEDGSNYDFLFSAADRALYHVKTAGRNGYFMASSGMFE